MNATKTNTVRRSGTEEVMFEVNILFQIILTIFVHSQFFFRYLIIMTITVYHLQSSIQKSKHAKEVISKFQLNPEMAILSLQD